MSQNLSSYTKILLFFLSYDTTNFRIAQKFPDSNATLLPGFFSLWPTDWGVSISRPCWAEVLPLINNVWDIFSTCSTVCNNIEQSNISIV